MKTRVLISSFWIGFSVASSAVPGAAQLSGASVESITGHLERLENGTPEEQHKAAHQLYELIRYRSPEFEALIESKVLGALEKQYRENANDRVRAMAVQALSESKSAEIIPTMIDCLMDSDPGIPRNALNSLRRFGPDAKDAIPTLIEGIKSGFLRTQAYTALMAIQGAEANETILPLLGRREFTDSEIGQVVIALRMHPDPRAAHFVEEALFSRRGATPGHATGYFVELGDRSPATIRVLRKCLASTSPPPSDRLYGELTGIHKAEYRREVRSQAIAYLASIEDAESLDKIREMLASDQSIRVRTEAAKAMGQYKDHKSIPLLFDRLKEQDTGFESIGHRNGELHRQAVTSLAKIGTRRALQALYDGIFVEESQERNRQACVHFWRRTSNPAHLTFFADAHVEKPLPGPLAASILHSLLSHAGAEIRLKGKEADAAKEAFLETVQDDTHFVNGRARPLQDNVQVEAQYIFYSNGLATVGLMFRSGGPPGRGRRASSGYGVVYRKEGNRWIPIGRTGSWVT